MKEHILRGKAASPSHAVVSRPLKSIRAPEAPFARLTRAQICSGFAMRKSRGQVQNRVVSAASSCTSGSRAPKAPWQAFTPPRIDVLVRLAPEPETPEASSLGG